MRALLVIPLIIGASSVGTLLLYFYGALDLGTGASAVILPAAAVLILFTRWAVRHGQDEIGGRVLAGIWAGALATLAYDLVRLPIAWAGIPVFKAISYFGTVMLDQASPSVGSEVAGWAYHLSNGVGFGLMYTAIVKTPRWWTAIAWGLTLEGAMLITPYAEVFGYRVSPRFLALTVGAHVVYGLVLWAALRWWLAGRPFLSLRPPGGHPLLTCLLVPVGLATIAADFHWRHGPALPPSPPAFLGPKLHTTWDVLEPDRLAVLWVYKRFVDREARFHFVAPFSPAAPGIPFDMPEAAIRRSSGYSATEVLLRKHRLDEDESLALLGRMTRLYEVTPWLLPVDTDAHSLGQNLLNAAGRCGPGKTAACVDRAFHFLDQWYTRKER